MKYVIALAILALGLMVGIIAALSPIGSFAQQHSGLISPINVDPNDYKTESLQMIKGETVDFTVQLDNSTVFRFYIMNSTQLPLYEKCAPKCMQPLLGGNGEPYYRQDGLERPPLFLNVTVTASSPLSDSFIAPSPGTYYFVFDNSEGPNYASYLGQNATGFTAGTLTISTYQVASSYAINWRVAIIAIGEILAGGILATVLIDPRMRKLKPGKTDRLVKRFGTMIAVVAIVAILLVDSPIFLTAYRNATLVGGSKTNTQTVVTSTGVSNYSIFEVDADYLDNVGPNGFGSLTIDSQDQFMYAAAKTNNSLYIYDLPDEAEQDVGGFNVPQSVLYVSQSFYQGELFVSNGGNGTVDILSDNSTGGIFGLITQRINEIPFPNPGSFAYDSTNGIIYVAYGNGSQSGVGVIDQNTSTELATISLPAAPAQIAVEQIGTRIFVNIPSLNVVDVIDKTTRQIIDSWPIGNTTGNVAMALDESNGRLFIGTTNPPELQVLDDNSGKILFSFSLQSPPGSLTFAPDSGLIVAACGSGVIQAYQELNPNSFVFDTTQDTGPGATSSVYFPSIEGEQVLVVIPPYDGQSSQVMTFVISVE